MKLTRYERETIILFNEKEKTANIYTYNQNLIKRLERYKEKYPTECQLKEVNSLGGHTYLINKARMSIKFLSPPSEASRKKAADTMRESRKYRRS